MNSEKLSVSPKVPVNERTPDEPAGLKIRMRRELAWRYGVPSWLEARIKRIHNRRIEEYESLP